MMLKKKFCIISILIILISSFIPAANAFAATANGWEKTNGTWYYYENGVKSTSKWVQGNDGKWYYLNANGAMATNQWVKHTDGKWYYLESDGAMATDKWIKHTDGKYYYVGSDGAMLTNTCTPDGYYVDSNGAWVKAKKTLSMEATAYSGGGITASGRAVCYNPNGISTIAVDPNVIGLGTLVYVHGYGLAVAADTGGLIKGNIIDVYFNSKSAANEWGRQYNVQVDILAYPGEW